MEKFEYEDEIYYFSKGQFYDDKFMAVEKLIADKLALFYFSKMDYRTMSADDLLIYIKQLKDAQQPLQAKNICAYGLDNFKYNVDFVRILLTMLLSLHRQTGSPQETVDTANKYLNIYGQKIASPAFYTSLAAAYCDLRDYANAKRYADRAYAMQGGGQGYSNEVSLVYKRIKAESNGKFADMDTD